MYFNQPYNQALMTDLYQLTMAAGYFQNGLSHRSTFELYFRRLPNQRSFTIAAGLAQAVEYLSQLHFTEAEINYLKNLNVFKHVRAEFFDYLKNFRFTGDVWAIPEGTPVFPNEPLLRISAPVIEAQIVETFLLSMINFQTLIAGKAARVCLAANQDGKDRGVVDFGARRAHGPDAAILAARASYIGGCLGTSNVYAGMALGIPVYGTAAHSWTMAFDSEMEAFKSYYDVFPEHAILLIDTYDTLQGAKKAVELGKGVKGVRLDSGDFCSLSQQVREILDRGGLEHAKILISGDMNEYKIADLIKRGACVDTFGVGTELVTSRDDPALNGVYKLVEQEETNGTIHYKLKLSSEKASYPGAKQVYRFDGVDGQFKGDQVALATENQPLGAQPLLIPVMKGGQILNPLPSLPEIQAHGQKQLRKLPAIYKHNEPHAIYPVERSAELEALFQREKEKIKY